MKIPFVSFKPMERELDTELRAAFTRVFENSWYIDGAEDKAFEEAFAKYCKADYCVGCGNGLDALMLTLKALGIGKGDEVIVPSNTFIATALAVTYVGATPIFVEPDINTFNINPSLIEEKITPKTKAIMPVHLYGQPADMDPILEIAEKHDLKVIEDAAQAHGSTYKGKKIGSIGDLGCFSFYPTKNMTTGEGGMVTTNDEELAEKSSMVRAHGESKRYEQSLLGYNYRMTDIAASIGLVQLKNIDQINKKRNENAEYLSEGLSDVKGITTPEIAENVTHVFHQYTIRVSKDRDAFKDFLTQKEIGTGVHYPIVLYKQPYYQNIGLTGNCPEAELAANQVISLPVHPSLTQEELDTLISAVKECSDKLL